jgi:uncharacterized protein YjiS (DUF1127 family)
MTFVNHTRTATAGWADRLGAYAATLREASRRRAVYRRTLAELRALSERDLADLGIHSAMIPQIAHEAAYGK